EAIQEKSRPMWDKEEERFCAFVDDNSGLIKNEFTVRMENAIEELCGIHLAEKASEQKKNISEILHDKLLGDLRVYIGKVLRDKKKVVVLIDNLDKAWETRRDLPSLSQFLFGLLNVGENITAQFQKSSSLLQVVDVKLIVFLRSDIF